MIKINNRNNDKNIEFNENEFKLNLIKINPIKYSLNIFSKDFFIRDDYLFLLSCLSITITFIFYINIESRTLAFMLFLLYFFQTILIISVRNNYEIKIKNIKK